MNITSDFCIVGAKEGREELATHIATGGKALVEVQVWIDTVHSRDDGASIEFSGSVQRIIGPVLKFAEPALTAKVQP